MPFYSVNGIKIDPTVFSRRIFSPQNRSDRFWTAFAVTGQKFPSRSFRCLLRFQHCKFGNSAFFSGRARRGPQTIWRTHGGTVKNTGSGQRTGKRRASTTAGTQPGNTKFLPLLYCTTFFCFAEACCAGRRQFRMLASPPRFWSPNELR